MDCCEFNEQVTDQLNGLTSGGVINIAGNVGVVWKILLKEGKRFVLKLKNNQCLLS